MSATGIVGTGAVTGYGWGFATLAAGLRSGTTAGRHQTIEGVDTVAATIPEVPLSLADTVAGDATLPRFERIARFAVADAVADARARGWAPGERVGVIFCTGIGDIESMRDNYMRDANPRPSLFPRLLHTAVGSVIAQDHRWNGPNVVVNAACSSGNVALELADTWLRAGKATDVVIAGAELCLVSQIITGFRRMRVQLGEGSPIDECRPFQEGSKRFFLGEAGIAFVVSDGVDRARATYLGGAQTHDAFHLVAPDPDGTQLARCYEDALAAADVKAGDVAVIKAHGSGTPINDKVELAVVDARFPSSTRLCTYKPLLGHCMAAAALVELAALLAGYELDALPGPVGGAPAHPRLSDGGAPPPGLALCGSVGLGGANTVAVLDIPRGPT